ncbi:putative DNA polymerase delta subunit 2 [Trypanosoma vivax]|nr:putative DNA polymerase delta subunit 2 [Trypanosoma vivax]
MAETLHRASGVDEVRTRTAVPIRRTHQRFLIRKCEVFHQYSAMYCARLKALKRSAMDALLKKIVASASASTDCIPPTCRLLDLTHGQRALCVGVVYKQMRLLTRFLDEYQRELVRIDAGGDAEDGTDMCEAIPPPVNNEEESAVRNQNDENDNCQPDGNLCRAGDELFMEDGSGRLLLEGVAAELFCTGLVVAVDGTLRDNGRLAVHSYSMIDLRELYVPRALAGVQCSEPLYVAVVCGFELGNPDVPNVEAAARGRTMVELLVDYLSGCVGSEAMKTHASRISRLIIGGNNIAITDELRLKRKVKLDPSDHVKLNDDKPANGTVTSAALMRQFDVVLERIAECIEVDLMPGENDMTTAFHPQQPIHPLLLPAASRCSTVRLVTNPYEFSLFPGDDMETPVGKSLDDDTKGETTFFVSSGSALNSLCRETSFSSRLDAMSMILRSGCACPTAPNTLFCYPFVDSDPFVFQRAPHCFVCCDQPRWETRWEPLDAFAPVDDSNRTTLDEECSAAASGVGSDGIRLVCVPPFSQTGILALIDINSPKLHTTYVNFKNASMDL